MVYSENNAFFYKRQNKFTWLKYTIHSFFEWRLLMNFEVILCEDTMVFIFISDTVKSYWLYGRCSNFSGLETWRWSKESARKLLVFIKAQFPCKIVFLSQTSVTCLWIKYIAIPYNLLIYSQYLIYIYREDFYYVDRFHGSALHGGRCTACCKAQTNFADESACLTADNVQNEGKFLPLFTNQRRCWKCCPSTCRRSSHRRKRFWSTRWSCSAGIFAISLRIFSFSSFVLGFLL
jgi:hypothetical protein